MHLFLLIFLLLLFTRRWFTLIYSEGNTVVFGWTLGTKAYLYYNILTVYLYYILSNVVFIKISCMNDCILASKCIDAVKTKACKNNV